MHKKILKIFSMILVLTILVSLVPFQGATAVSKEQDAQLKQELKDLYVACKKQSGRWSFDGYCGSLVSWQLYILGITDKLLSANGNTHFDNHAYRDYTSGGYRIHTYGARNYSLEEALKAITHNGTKEAYNILVGFERTNSWAGSRYGHAVLITAIVDGVVYFSESYAVTINGTYYREGAPITCTIAQFVKYYARWSQLDGVIHFGKKTYADTCTYYPSYLYAGVTHDVQLYSEPCLPEVDERSKPLRVVKPGERISVTGLYRNEAGEYWYQVEDEQTSYIPAEWTQVLSMRYDDITISGVDAPAELRQGRGFNVKGKLKSQYNEITTVRAQVFAYSGEVLSHVMSTTHTLNGSSYSLSGTKLSNQLTFRKLDVGAYRYELAVVVGNNFYADGQLQTDWQTLKLWRSDFQVVTREGGSYQVEFDANGGTSQLNQAEVAKGDSLSAMPEAQREGYIFGGWYTADGEEVTENTVIPGNITLIAKWLNAEDVTGWYVENGSWVYLENGVPKTGFVTTDGIIYHINENGSMDIGWVTIEGRIYYFNGNGAMYLGWLETDEGTYYFTEAGAAVGWAEIDADRYYFDENGHMVTGQMKIDGKLCSFGEDGILDAQIDMTIPGTQSVPGSFLDYHR